MWICLQGQTPAPAVTEQGRGLAFGLIRRVELLLIAVFPAAVPAQDTTAVLSAVPTT